MFKVLVVDDDNGIIMFMSRLLKNKFDCHVSSAENGLEALAILEDEEFDIIFLDVTMPIMNGIETLEAIRSSEMLKDIPVIFLSAIADKEVIAKVNKLNVKSYMLKPLTYDSAFKAIKSIFDKILFDRKNANSFEALVEEEQKDTRKIVIIDPDDNFKEKFRQKLAERFTIYDSSSGAKGLNVILKEKPDYIFIAENLKPLSEKFIATKIGNLLGEGELEQNFDSENGFMGTQIYLIKSNIDETGKEVDLNEISEEEKSLYDEVFIKSNEPDILLKGISKALKF